jgi:tRNA wybutosine-synthesizing protein 4
LTRYPESCQDVVFVDIDFPDLMLRKRRTVLDTPELRDKLTGLEIIDDAASAVFLKSDQYVQIGCDLRRVKTIQDALTKAVGDVLKCSFFFVAEVSITYMETEGADGVIKWASSVGDGVFLCSLHQGLRRSGVGSQSHGD